MIFIEFKYVFYLSVIKSCKEINSASLETY